ncbi:hypothetical protein N7456_012015 [Penicillium angulare]|uniref:Uncharacterized protein n=1 Tax=Penicillium angulare TaxID=116970 RepID=A0A9W9EV02_9EURO|nr:hypothetical protein N7456_012015 [Penicillium angulare]
MPQTRNLSRPLALRKRRLEENPDEHEDHTTSMISNENGGDQSNVSPATTPSKKKAIKANYTFLIGIDFGTTMTSVSYYKPKKGKRSAVGASKAAIKPIINWPGAASGQNRGEVPSESLYANGEYYWGYGAQRKAQALLSEEVVDAARKPIKFAKLFLENCLTNPDLQNRRDEHSLGFSPDSLPPNPPPRAAPYEGLRETLEVLGKDVRDVIRDYLIEVLGHSMTYLTNYESFKRTDDVEWSLSVPAGWPLKASWALQDILKQAVETVGFGQGLDLFLVNEPEAASAFAFEMFGKEKIIQTNNPEQDVTTYTVKSRSPFRISEVGLPNGDNCGSIYVNQAMEMYFNNLLRDNEALERKGISAEQQIQHGILPNFETGLKRIFDYSESGPNETESFIIQGIEPDSSRGFEKNRVNIPHLEIKNWFQRSIDDIFKLVQQQLDLASSKGKEVRKVILVGGFSQSPTMRHALKEYLDPLSVALWYRPDGEAETLVSRGAVYRAADKTEGPSRHIIANIGVLQHESKNSSWPGHRDVHKHTATSKVAKKVWIRDCGQLVENNEVFIEQHHQVFKEDENWEFSQRLYYSVADKVEDHYRLDHPKNAEPSAKHFIYKDAKKQV